mmetsp:Transcript_22611/g.85691  ORF Transcript_22611/g.85691 Transcript_22611/m.85691 type:complete len:281 (-) Transcript_22611:1106-1948(-)
MLVRASAPSAPTRFNAVAREYTAGNVRDPRAPPRTAARAGSSARGATSAPATDLPDSSASARGIRAAPRSHRPCLSNHSSRLRCRRPPSSCTASITRIAAAMSDPVPRAMESRAAADRAAFVLASAAVLALRRSELVKIRSDVAATTIPAATSATPSVDPRIVHMACVVDSGKLATAVPSGVSLASSLGDSRLPMANSRPSAASMLAVSGGCGASARMERMLPSSPSRRSCRIVSSRGRRQISGSSWAGMQFAWKARVYRRNTRPGASRPARPLRCVADA